MDIQVGDRVYWKYIDKKENFIHINIVTSISDKDCINQGDKIILKIERPKYEVVEEKKELLTEEERKFLKDICKYYKDISQVSFKVDINVIVLHDKNFYAICSIDYPDSMKFDNIKKDNDYTLEELGLE